VLELGLFETTHKAMAEPLVGWTRTRMSDLLCLSALGLHLVRCGATAQLAPAAHGAHLTLLQRFFFGKLVDFAQLPDCLNPRSPCMAALQ
jgi:hypothetical protein